MIQDPSIFQNIVFLAGFCSLPRSSRRACWITYVLGPAAAVVVLHSGQFNLTQTVRERSGSYENQIVEFERYVHL